MNRLVSLMTFSILLIVNSPSIDADKPAFITDALIQLSKPLTEYCKSTTNITSEQIKKVNTGNFQDGKIIGCYSHCLWKRLDLLDENGNVKIEAIKNLLPDEFQEKIIKLVLDCQQRHPPSKNDKCVRSLNIQKCYFETSPQMYYLL